MARIRVCCFLPSLPEVYAPVILPTDTNAVKEQKNQHFRIQPKKGLMVYIENPAGETFPVGIVDLFNVKPNFLSGINEFFSDLPLYGIQFGYKIVVEIIDRGYGLLQTNEESESNDYISITGFVEEKTSFLQDENDIIYNFVL
jgi:hypothetical protein